MTTPTLIPERIAFLRSYWTGKKAEADAGTSNDYKQFCDDMLVMCDMAEAWLGVQEKVDPHRVREIVEIVGNDIVIRIPIESLSIAVPVALGQHRGLEHGFTVSDDQIFARELLLELKEEREDGTTLVTDMMDAAVEQAMENGAEGLEFPDASLSSLPTPKEKP